MGHDADMEVRRMMDRDFGQHRSAAPGVLAAWAGPGASVPMKEVIAIIRPSRWTATKARVQRLKIPAFTQHRVLGRGAEGGLWDRQAVHDAAVRYLPKRMISWIVEAPLVAPLVQAILEENRTGQPGDGKVFVLPMDDALRVRTGERGLEALKPEYQHESVIGTTTPQERQGGTA